ncbi:unnamed protein product [Bursaphelenchus xylophilus]|uniref:(pine wood nematode) hypothetical protein n=1 Tax=Bursaphelenchus xylophilus TaxID=6326 RepID=A0A7I8XKV6_BURXY|nr:unnamed protein product [Bursaphelenchus xylophilus]CAG9120500.1 unnamed protein product [Bursaphelenchus xylophilus]
MRSRGKCGHSVNEYCRGSAVRIGLDKGCSGKTLSDQSTGPNFRPNPASYNWGQEIMGDAESGGAGSENVVMVITGRGNRTITPLHVLEPQVDYAEYDFQNLTSFLLSTTGFPLVDVQDESQ